MERRKYLGMFSPKSSSLENRSWFGYNMELLVNAGALLNFPAQVLRLASGSPWQRDVP